MIPTQRTLYFLAFGALLAILPIWQGRMWVIPWLGYMAAVFLLLIVSPFLVWGFRQAKVVVSMPKLMYVGGRDEISVKISCPMQFAVKARLRLETVGQAKWEMVVPLEQIEREANCIFQVTPLRRGMLEVKTAVVRIGDILGLWEIERNFPGRSKAKVFPDLRSVGKYAIKFFGDPQARTGMKVDKHRGEGSEFESLRDYVPGFDIRTLDWKASARKGKLVCREFQAEKNNDILIALDCGHLMAAEFKGLTKLDHAINSLLIIAYVAIKSGDRVGFMSFDEQVHGFLRPQSQVGMVQKISNECVDLSYRFKPTNFVLPMEYLLAQQKRRALIIIMTDFTDSISAEVMKDYLFLLSRRHLVLFISVRDPFLDTYVRKSPRELMDMHKKVACYNLKGERLLMFQELRRMGVHWLDLAPDNISVPMLNKYIEIRRRELI